MKKTNFVKQNRNKGFTLVELLMVISIIAILVLAASSSFVNSQKKSRDVSRKTELKNLSDALNMYYADKGFFPGNITFGGEFSENSGSKKVIYMKKTPIEKVTGNSPMRYEVSDSHKSFRLYTNLENNEDKDCLSSAVCSSLGYSISVGCCYVVTSSNIGLTVPVLP